MRDHVAATHFFTDYQTAYGRFSAPDVAKLHVLPAFVCDHAGQRVAQTRASLERDIISQFDHLTALGYQSSIFTLAQFRPLGPTGSQVNIDWTLDTDNGTCCVGSFYLCRWFEHDDAWRIACTYIYPRDN